MLTWLELGHHRQAAATGSWYQRMPPCAATRRPERGRGSARACCRLRTKCWRRRQRRLARHRPQRRAAHRPTVAARQRERRLAMKHGAHGRGRGRAARAYLHPDQGAAQRGGRAGAASSLQLAQLLDPVVVIHVLDRPASTTTPGLHSTCLRLLALPSGRLDEQKRAEREWANLPTHLCPISRYRRSLAALSSLSCRHPWHPVGIRSPMGCWVAGAPLWHGSTYGDRFHTVPACL
jgi:hypothetical protein